MSTPVNDLRKYRNEEVVRRMFEIWATDLRPGAPQAIARFIPRPNGSAQAMGMSSANAPARNADFCATAISPM